ncbi:MAG TPA: SAM-dependent methyltransferase [Bacteroidales bacterium]|nr:SAM-dependent methyltransferase [Bacteroidales bacterium]
MLIEGLNGLKKYFNFRLKSKPRGGHGIHSPFVYDFYTQCIDVKSKKEIFDKIETVRKELLLDKSFIELNDLGSGTKTKAKSIATVADIAKRNSAPSYKGKMLHRLTAYLKPETVIELGTSLGISTMYIASGLDTVKVYTIEGDSNLSKLAIKNFNKIGLTNVNQINGDFDAKLPELFSEIKSVGIAYVDGNHTEEATLRYFKLLSARANSDTLIIFDDIRWSKGMESAWNTICNDENVSISIDMFDCGLAFFRKGVVKQHFTLRYGPF